MPAIPKMTVYRPIVLVPVIWNGRSFSGNASMVVLLRLLPTVSFRDSEYLSLNESRRSVVFHKLDASFARGGRYVEID